MGVLVDTWCFCNGGGKSERMKASIFTTKGPAMAHIAASGTGFLIHRNLLLTTHLILPCFAAAEAAEIQLQNGVASSLFPNRFFITSSVLDLTIVGLDVMDGDTNAHVQQPHYLKTCSKPNLELGNVVYLLGYSDKKELTVGEGKVVIATDNLIKLSTDGISWSPGTAGFDIHGNLAFIVCDPMKLATSSHSKSSSASPSSSSSRKDCPMQFGIPIPIICDWLNQHWEGNLDDLNKPKLPITRLISAGQKSEHSCASFTMRRVFKSTEAENGETPSSSNRLSKPREHCGPSCSAVATNMEDEALTTDLHAVHGIRTPEIYESPNLTSIPVRKKESTHIQLLNINFPPRIAKFPDSAQPARKIPSSFGENFVNKPPLQQPVREGKPSDMWQSNPVADAEIASTGSVNGVQSEVQSSSSPIKILEMENGYSSDGQITMYSAETAESRNIPSPREGRFQQVGRSQSCVNYNRWGTVQKNSGARRAMLEQQRSGMQGRKVYSQGATSQRSNDYYSPTVSSIMKKRSNLEPPIRRNILEPPTRPRQSAVNSSPRWNF
ncbi:uncharacterized protein LOC107819658 [Nicotiana tabacum]|uniref:Uncharacterized protein LOC107819658 n=1 Tax=Nicotiana tabacum TaxID=4097 RepID=A0A1S4CJT9_TOBAC|nr:uncharacterized protein LOC104119871 isoform X1 [Nicotiana tomentosiformis]XP_016501276.1 PREDICTED: uncharacterized protein LOC107819658 [Nicotiana tabacum]